MYKVTEMPEQEGRIITCVFPKGRSLKVVEVLNEKGITRANFAFARGFDIHDAPGRKGIPNEEEKEMLFICAESASEADEIMDFVFEAGDMNRLGGGMIYTAKLNGALSYMLPNLANDEVKTPAVSRPPVEETKISATSA
jgi:hypothetical protein